MVGSINAKLLRGTRSGFNGRKNQPGHAMKSRPFAFSLVALLALGLPGHAMADCITHLLGISNPCDGCTYEGTMATGPDETCVLSASSTGLLASPMAFLSARIIERAKHGVAATNGNSIAYSPTKGYVGSDDFVVERAFELSGRTGKYKVHYHVSIK